MDMSDGRLIPSPDGPWCILRTSGSRTLTLVATLSAAGIEAWTPTGVKRYRASRVRARKVRPIAIAPSFVFVRAVHLPEVFRALARPTSQHPPFSMFKHDGRVPLIADRSIAGLKAAEQAARDAEDRRLRDEMRKRKREEVRPGQRVRVPDAAFTGLVGVVEETDGRTATISFGGLLTCEVDSWHLILDDVEPTSA